MTPAAENTYGNRFQFGEYALDINEHALKRAGREVVLRPKSFETLAFLVQRHGRLVTKDELLTTLWAGVVVTEGNLTHCIEEIRSAFGDDPHQPRFIQTVPRLGYRFIADVNLRPDEIGEEFDVEEDEYTAVKVRFHGDPETSADTRMPFPQVSLPGSVQANRRRTVILIAISGIVLLAAAFLYSYFRHDRVEIINSLAVLPFENLSGMAGEEYFADGLTDALIADIARFSRLRVISRTSVMQYKDSPKSLREIGNDLQVDAVVEGSVFRSGDRVRITAALISTREEKRLWAETYELDQSDLLTLIRGMAGTVAREIQIELTAAEQAHLMSNATVDPSVYELYLKGRHHWNKRTQEGFRKGIECFERALAADSTYAAAYAGLADCYNMMGDYDLIPPNMAFPKARTAALKALAFDSSLAEAHASLGFSAMHFDWNWPEVEREYRRAIALNPNCSNAHHWFALFLAMQGRFSEAKDEIQMARILDPLSLIIISNVAWVYYFARDNVQAVAACREAMQMDSTFVSAHVKLGWAYEQLQLYDEAEAAFRKANASVGSDPYFSLMIAQVLAVRGKHEEATAMIRRAMTESQGIYVSGYHVAAVYTGLGENRSAMDWLWKAYTEKSGWLAWLKVDPKFDRLRDNPEFVSMLDTLGLR